MLITDRLWHGQGGKYFCISTKSVTDKWEDHWFTYKDFPYVPSFIRENLDKNVYVCPHGFTRKVRQKPYAVDPKCLYADLDATDPRTLDLRPTIALESSPGRYVGYWMTDEPASEELNRRLSYSIGADVSGWDRTQVLRAPSTRNFKYDPAPRGRILWVDGPEYEVHRLEKIIPQKQSKSGEKSSEAAARIYADYEKKLPRWVRRELVNGNPTQGKRSEVLWKLQNELLEVGMSRDEAFQLLWACPWNKFRDRRDGEDQLWRELDKSVDSRLSGDTTKSKKEDEEGDPYAFRPLSRSLAEVEVENIDWIIPSMLARRELTIVEGDPGLGKSYFVQMIAKSICDGTTIPSEVAYEPVMGKVAYFDTENTAATVTKGRLLENGCKNLHNYFQEEEPFSIDDEEKWEAMIAVVEELQPTLIVFDTINIYIGGADTHKASETYQAMAPFKQLASRFNCAVVILRHLTKGSKEKALYRGQGSISVTGVARIVATIGMSPDDEDTRIVACTKINIAKRFRSFAFRIDGLPDTRERTNRSILTFGDFVDFTSDDIISVVPVKNNDREVAAEWLKGILEGDRVDSAKIMRMGEARGMSKTTVNRAADSLGVVKSSTGFGQSKKSFWSLPEANDNRRPKPKRRTRGRTPGSKNSADENVD